MTAEKKLRREFLWTALAGGALGILAKMCDTMPQGDPLTNMMFNFGLLSSGLLLWMTVCTWLALRAKCGLHAALSVLSFLVPMLGGYYWFSARFTGYFNRYVMYFWVMLLLPAAVMAWVLRANAGKPWLRFLGVTAAIVGVLCDIFVVHCIGTIPTLFGEMALFGALCYFLNAECGVRNAELRARSWV